MAHLELNSQTLIECRRLAEQIAAHVKPMIAANTTVSIERAALRLIGVEGSVKKSGLNYPLVNAIIDDLREDRLLSRGALYWFANALLHFEQNVEELCKNLCENKINLATLPQAPFSDIKAKAFDLCKKGLQKIAHTKEERDGLRKKLGDSFVINNSGKPLKYVIVATGNIYEDVVQARAAVEAGADAIAVIRSTAQSLLDYVPEGATTEGFGGTYATQENFKIMRKALDEIGEKHGRYIRLTNYSSGLCMSEIAAMAAIERLDFLLNDAMYGILFRDINMKRTLIDQHFSRMIIAYSDIVIHTGEDNYLTTADAVENGHQVLASQFINERFAKSAGMKEHQMGLGHAAEMNPWHPNVFLLEVARAQMTRDIFPKAPIKFMPPTRHKVGDIFFSHVMDAMFNMVSVLTGQSIHLLGMPTEAIHTPLMQDRWMSIKSTNYIFGGAADLGKEISFKKDGIIARFANKVLDDTLTLLRKIERENLFKAIEAKAFANVSRAIDGGKGLDGVLEKNKDYLNPFFELI